MTVRGEIVSNELPMTVGPLPLGAHDGGRRVRRRLEQLIDAVRERPRLHVVGVPAKIRIANRGVARIPARLAMAAELFQMQVADGQFFERRRETILTEVRLAA